MMESIEVTTKANSISNHINIASEHHRLALILGIVLPVFVLLSAASVWFYQHAQNNRRRRELIDELSDQINVSTNNWESVQPVVETKSTMYCHDDVERNAELSHPLERLKTYNPNLDISLAADVPKTPAPLESSPVPILALSLSLMRKARSPLSGLVTHLSGRSRTPSIDTIDLFIDSDSSAASSEISHHKDSFVESGNPEVKPVATARDIPTLRTISLDTVTSSTGLISLKSLHDRDTSQRLLNIGMSVCTGSGVLQSGVEAEGEEEAEICWPSKGSPISSV